MRTVQPAPEVRNLPILALETKGAESLHKSLKKGELIRLEKITSNKHLLTQTGVRLRLYTAMFDVVSNMPSFFFVSTKAR